MKYTPATYTISNSDLNLLITILTDSSVPDPHHLVNYWLAKMKDPDLVWSVYEGDIQKENE